MTFAQNKEDLVVSSYFGNYKGRLLDIGANDGITFSNSRLLILNGWSADLFEPSTAFGSIYSLYRDNPNVSCYPMGIATKTGVRTLYESGSHLADKSDIALLSTTKPTELKRWQGVDFRKKDANFISFIEWYDAAHEIDPTPIDFISLDVEGMEMEILTQIDLNEVGCRCICIEWNSVKELGQQFDDDILPQGFSRHFVNAENIIYIKK